ncbi:Ornithine aminotransferase [Mycena venus]|uniref:ornithine aminotransferase n=1 Tax=Mycena venus TaxID=2733690 RepID=A0A8H6Z3P7_9AGAR|nr:Ornithine aminotransferase [Mycena venus]
MSPSATSISSPFTNGNGKHHATNGKTNGNGVATKNGKNGKAHLSSTELIHLEHEHAAHNYHPLPVVFDRALGAKVWDPEGREYIDMLSAYSAVNQGHCHPAIVASLVAQAQKLTLSSRAFHNSVFGLFAKEVGRVFGWEMVLPMNTGAEAVESALKLARKWAYLKKGVQEGEAIVLSVEGNFHGRTLGVVSMSTDPSARAGFGPYLPNVGPTFVDGAKTRVIRFGEISDLERALELHGPRVAAFLVEPIQGEAGIIVPPQGYLRAVHALCKKHNVLLICDEIQTGLGRTGKMLACEHEGVRPDVVLLGKALSGGVYPVSAVLADREVMLCIQPGEHGSTYGGNPLACAVSITALRVLIDEDLSGRAARLGELFRSSVIALKVSVSTLDLSPSPLHPSILILHTRCTSLTNSLQSPLIQTVRGVGLLNAVVIDEERCNANRRARGENVEGDARRTAWQFCLLLKERGVLAKTTHGNVVRFAPPLVIEEEDLLKAVKIIGECLVDLDRLDEIPGDDSEEHGHVDMVDN